MDEIFEKSFSRFLSRARTRILDGTEERNLRCQLAACIEEVKNEAGLFDHRADTELNTRHNRLVKTVLGGEIQIVNISCGLILHSMGLVERDNLIAIEMKRAGGQDQRELIRERLRTMTMVPNQSVFSADGVTRPEDVCGYELATFIELDATRVLYSIEKFKRGRSLEVASGEITSGERTLAILA